MSEKSLAYHSAHISHLQVPRLHYTDNRSQQPSDGKISNLTLVLWLHTSLQC